MAPVRARASVALALVFAAAAALEDQTTTRAQCSAEDRWGLSPDQCCDAPAAGRQGFAYMTLLGGVDNSYKYRGYLYNIAIMGRVLRDAGSTADVVALLIMAPRESQLKHVDQAKPECSTPPEFRDPNGGNPPLERLPREDAALLERNGVKVRYVEAMFGDTLDFGSMVFAKTIVWQHTEYEAVQFLDADIMPLRNMDGFFGLPRFTVCAGMVSPLNAGWLRLEPSCKDYSRMRQLVVEANEWGRAMDTSRPAKEWNKQWGWGSEGDPVVEWKVLTGNEYTDWKFHHASSEQGLYYYYFSREVRSMDQLLYQERLTFNENGATTQRLAKPRQVGFTELDAEQGFPCLRAGAKASYVHFTGSRKPWNAPDRFGVHENTWWTSFDKLGTGLKREEIPPGCFASPLGYYAKTPKDAE